jgi:hypothetical protein
MEFRTVEIEDTMPNVSGTTSGLAAGVERKERGSLQFRTMIRRGARGLHLDSVSAVGIPGNRGCIPAQADVAGEVGMGGSATFGVWPLGADVELHGD